VVIIRNGTYHSRRICGEKFENILKCHFCPLHFLLNAHVCFAEVGRWGGVDEAADGYPRCLWLNVSHEVAVKLPARVVSLQGSSGTTRSISKCIHKVVGRPQICFQVNPHRRLSRAAVLCGSWPPPQQRANGQGETPQSGRESAQDGSRSLF